MTAATRSRILPTLFLTAAFLACAAGTAVASNLVVAGAWIRQPPPGTDVAAVYLSLQNAGTQTVKLTGVKCPLAKMAMMHETLESGGESRMRAMPQLSLAPGASVAFAPGGRHIMLQGLAHPLQVGERVPITLEFAGGIKVNVIALVRPLGAG